MENPRSKLLLSSKVFVPTYSSSRTPPKHTNELKLHSSHLGFAEGTFTQIEADEGMRNVVIMMLIYGPNPKN